MSTEVLLKKKTPPVLLKKRVATQKKARKPFTPPISQPLLPPSQLVVNLTPRKRIPPIPKVDIYPPLIVCGPLEDKQMEVGDLDPVQMEINKLELANTIVKLNEAIAQHRQLKVEVQQEQKERKEKAQHE